MRFALLFSTFFCLLASNAWGVNVAGFVAIEQSGYYFIESQTQSRYEIKAATVAVDQALKKLSNFDSISGKGTIVDGRVLVLDNIDFVGLRKLLGLWQSRGTVLDFIDYNEVSFYFPMTLSKRISAKKTIYRYAVAPATGQAWRVFFSDDNSVTLGSLYIQDKKAVIELFDPETGETSQVIRLEKVKP